ncbi:primosomal protein N' [Clostridium sp. 'White wine YQ']|uniref:primosomal protein N' n=1 Tax=Clostridium sp. 'White wine YQ' TaxID=3027474 RepID=UPI002365CDC0|nr:primosomal protein N' [Clostridium sp. 'White wine YQ']MDD7793738.1 primosomal protein N' [Clostridium sp. 'White wine YQ']
MYLYAKVVINSDAVSIDKLFTYKIPEETIQDIVVGSRVLVPFGMGNRSYEAFVLSISCEPDTEYKNLKSIIKALDDTPLIDEKGILLFNYLVNNYLCRKIEAIRLIIPTGVMRGVKEKSKEVVILGKEIDGKLKEKESYISIINFITTNEGLYTRSELITKFKLSSYMIGKLLKEGYLSVTKEKIERYNDKDYNFYKSFELNEEQKKAYDEIINSDERLFLIKGVTGSGKTEIYMKLVKEMLSKDKTSLILVPEISLTPQMIERFKGRFGKDVAVFHSKLSLGERYDEWFRVKEGKVKLVVGARSAIFLPFKNLGLIVIDEEHEGTYKSEQNPKYQTKEVADFISQINNCKVVYASATPSVESYYNALNGKYKLIQLNNRVNNKPMPKMKIIDMRQELKNNNRNMFSRELFEKLSHNLDKKEQSIIFLNRRGFSTFVSCRSCGYVYKCPHCDISMTYHNNGYLICHYCGTAKKIEKLCPKCGSKYIKHFGAGTEKVEGEIKKLFPNARVLRMDVDTTRNKDSHEKIYNSFKNGEADILVGTQMISKGLDFPNVTLVGVVAADTTLNLPDYRSGERTYQLITQVAGRAGRGDKLGEVIIQSYTPEHYSLTNALNENYDNLYNEEISARKLLKYPPFGDILLVQCTSKNEALLKDFMRTVNKEVSSLINKDDVDILGPSPCIIGKIKENYRWQLVFKGNLDLNLCRNIKDRVYQLGSNVYNDIKISIDINPNSLI